MAYTAWSVSFGEQPSAAKWNLLGSNDASFADGTGIANIATDVTAISNPYKFSVHRNAAANTGNGLFVKIDFDTEAFDTNNNFASGTYTAPVSGFYQFNARASCAVTTQFLLAIYVNGSVVKRGTHVLGNGTVGCDLSVLLQLSATNTVEIHSLGNGGALEVATGVNVWFTGHLVSRT